MIDSSVAVRVDDLRKRYGGMWKRRVEALRGVTFEVPKGQIFGLLGPNGAGKTTIIKVLLGIVRASGGSANLLGHPAGNRRGRENVGYLPENLQISPHQTAQTALEYYGRLSGMDHSTIKERGASLLKRVGLQGREKESVKQFSKGMRQRLGLAQALLHDPELLILDEPTDGLDPVGRSQVRDIMRQLSNEGRTVFVNSHLLQEVELVCDHVAILNRGELQFIGSVKEFTAVPDSSDLEVQIVATDEQIQQALPGKLFVTTDGRNKNIQTLRMEVHDQTEINHVVDSLRQNGISIESLYRKKKTLEDFFLDIVNKNPFEI